VCKKDFFEGGSIVGGWMWNGPAEFHSVGFSIKKHQSNSQLQALATNERQQSEFSTTTLLNGCDQFSRWIRVSVKLFQDARFHKEI